MDNDIPFDVEIRDILEDTYKKATILNDGQFTPDQLKLMILATNLQSLANTFLLADKSPGEVKMDLKKVALGILGTHDWIQEGFTNREGLDTV